MTWRLAVLGALDDTGQIDDLDARAAVVKRARTRRAQPRRTCQ